MFSWPQLPSVSLPATIQRRFFSFVLKRSLGHLVKPGQFDSAQIDAQIGSGYVQVNDVKLDHDAVNEHLADLPVPVRLENGCIGKIAVQIPWSNLFSSPFSLSLSTLSLTFVLVPQFKKADHIVHATGDIAESVVSVAESFIHGELSEPGGHTLWEGLHLESHSQRQPPGSIDPFLSTEDLDAGHHSQGYDEGDDNDRTAPSTQGVSLLATLIERLISKFAFDASDITLRFILPQKAEFTVKLGKLTYRTVNTPGDPAPVRDGGELRTISVSELALSIRDLTPSLPLTTRQHSASSLTSSSSEEDDEEDAAMNMSQSIASLPPPLSPHSISPGSSMYHSATSSACGPSPEPTSTTGSGEPASETVLSLGGGTEPMVLSLITPPLVVPEVEAGSSPGRTIPTPRFQLRSTDEIRLTLTVGHVAVALKPVHARSIRNLSSALSASHAMPPENIQPYAPSVDPFYFALNVKSITFLLLQQPSSLLPTHNSSADLLQHFFHARSPLSTSPRIPHLRIQLEAIEISRESSPASTAISSCDATVSATSSTVNQSTSKHHVKACLNELSVFAFFLRVHETGESWIASPVLISDPNLETQYKLEGGQSPMFEVNDWRKGGAAKVNQWRVRPPHGKRRSSGAVPSSTGGSLRTPYPPIMKARIDSGALGHSAACEVDIIPLHLFVDVGIVDGAMRFLNAATPTPLFIEGRNMKEDTPPTTPRAKGPGPWVENEELQERKRLETLLLKDFSNNDVEVSSRSNAGINFALRLALFRIQVRAPPPASWSSGQRSGALVVDMHSVEIMRREVVMQGRAAKFEAAQTCADPNILGIVGFKMLLAATTPPGDTTATTFLSIVPHQVSAVESSPTWTGTVATSSMASASVYIRSSPVTPQRPSTTNSPGTASSFSLDAQLPSVKVAISKPTFDGLAFLADDIVQHLTGDSDRVTGSDASGRSRDPSLIGSKFFTKRMASSGSSESCREGRKSEMVVKVAVLEAKITLLMPRESDAGKARPIDVTASDIDFLAEFKAEGKDETVVTVGIMDLHASNMSASGNAVTILRLTVPRFHNPTSKPLIKLRFISVVDNDTAAKESRLKVTASEFTYFFTPEYDWIADLGLFFKTPEGAFESVVPSDRMKVALKVSDGSFHFLAPKHSGASVVHIEELDCTTDLVGDCPETLISMALPSATVLFIDDVAASQPLKEGSHHGAESWKHAGYTLLAELCDFVVALHLQHHPLIKTRVLVDSMKLRLHGCADTLPAVGSFASEFGCMFHDSDEKSFLPKRPTPTSRDPHSRPKRDVLGSVDENAFRRIPDLGHAPDMIHDDLPTNLDYLDASFGAAAGLREVRDEDLFDFEQETLVSGRSTPTPALSTEGVIANFGGETIRMLDPQGIQVVERHFENIQPEVVDLSVGDTRLNFRVRNCDLTISLYDGYDWARTRKAIEDEVKAVRRRLVKIRQLLASGQVPDDSIEETSVILFNSVYIGLRQDPDELDPGALLAAIDEELNDGETEAGSQSSWQSFKRNSPHRASRVTRVRGRKLARSRGSRIDFCFTGVRAEVDQFNVGAPLVAKVLVTVRDLEILDHIKTSTWKKFLTELRTDFRGNIRETASDMVRTELRIVHPVPGLATEEGRLRAKVLPIKLHVDQDALDFMKKFFSFEAPDVPAVPPSTAKELYFQHVEVFPVDIKLDYKPKRVDYKALREGRTIELMNFFHFDGAEITLRHITLSGITGWSRLFETLNDLWTPDVKANQLADIISGVSPVRSLVNVGSGVADLVLLPIAQYKKDKRVVRGVQKGTTSFVKSTAMEAIKLGARLATGTQVILEQAETVLGGQGQFRDTVTTEALQVPIQASLEGSDEESETAELISKYADQPLDVQEGMRTAYRSLAKNLNSAAQTILAIPMEVYERSGNEGPVRAVVRAVPIAVLKPMIGASEAVSKTLFGLRNTMDPEIRLENEAKYKQR